MDEQPIETGGPLHGALSRANRIGFDLGQRDVGELQPSDGLCFRFGDGVGSEEHHVLCAKQGLTFTQSSQFASHAGEVQQVSNTGPVERAIAFVGGS